MRTTNNFRKIFTASLYCLALFFISYSASATDPKPEDKETKKVSVEEQLLIDELLVELEDAWELEESLPVMVEVYDSNNELVFSGDESQFAAQKGEKLVALKRKSEFLFEMDGTKVYKVF